MSFPSSLEANSAKELYVESMAACKGSQIQSFMETAKLYCSSIASRSSIASTSYSWKDSSLLHHHSPVAALIPRNAHGSHG